MNTPQAAHTQSRLGRNTDAATRILTSLFGQPVVPFRTFDQQDSGCIAWGVEVNGERLLVKYADHDSRDGRGCRAVEALQSAIKFHEAVAHPSIVSLLTHRTLSEGVALIFPWVDGEVLSSPEWPDRRTNPGSPFSRFLRLTTARKLAALDAIIDAHRAVAAAGYIAVDFYLGCVLYNFNDHRVRLIDFDHYHPGPYVLDADRQLGSRSLMPQEEFRRGARIDVRATIYTIGKMALEFLGDRTRTTETWEASAATYNVVHRATEQHPNDRYDSYAAFFDDWCASRQVDVIPQEQEQG